MFPFFSSKKYLPLNQIVISSAAIKHNHQVLQDFHPEAAVCPVLKSNAYGHGLTTVAPVFDSLGCAFLTVDSLFEAYELYKTKVKTEILILGYTNPENFKVKKLPFEYAVYDLNVALALNEYQPGCNIHLFVDTGMHREGVQLNELPSFLTELKKLQRINLVGVTSHFADADNPKDSKFVDQQIAEFKKAVEIIQDHGFNPVWKHISASGGSFKVIDKTFNMIRAGLAHYASIL